MKNYMLHTSEGVRDFFGNELKIKEKLIANIKKGFSSYGYNMVQTLTFEYIDVFLPIGFFQITQEFFGAAIVNHRARIVDQGRAKGVCTGSEEQDECHQEQFSRFHASADPMCAHRKSDSRASDRCTNSRFGGDSGVPSFPGRWCFQYLHCHFWL